jgi:hypothetical protein
MDISLRLELLRKLEDEWNEILKKKHKYPPEMFKEMEREKELTEFMLKYGFHGKGFFETTKIEIEDMKKYVVGSATLGEMIRKVVNTIKEISEQPY